MDLDADVLIERVGLRPQHILKWMVTVQDAIPPTFVPKTPGSFDIGQLRNLPLELLYIVFESLDFRSLSRFACVCHRGKATVESLPAYRDLIKHAFTTLVIFSRAKLVTFHSAGSIHKPLLSNKCVACEHFAPFLFLQTSERCCHDCLHRDRSFRLRTSAMARKCFGLTPTQLRRIPSMLSLLGVGYFGKEKRRNRLFSLKQAEALGVGDVEPTF